jgi:protein-disulfide isomerase
MNARTGLAVVVLAAVVAAIVSAGALLLFGPARNSTVAVANAGLNLDNPANRKALTKVVHDYLVQNPEVLVDMSNELDKRQKQAEADQQKKAIAKDAKLLFHSPNGYVAGDPNGTASVVEFFDYNCGFCKHALPEIVKLTKNDPHVRIVLKELPIFGKDSEDASRVALASLKQDPSKYFELHQRLFEDPGTADLNKALKIAGELGLNTDQLKQDMHDKSIDATLDENRHLAVDLGLQGTPLYLVGEKVIPGAPTDLYEELQQGVAASRKQGCGATC